VRPPPRPRPVLVARRALVLPPTRQPPPLLQSSARTLRERRSACSVQRVQSEYDRLLYALISWPAEIVEIVRRGTGRVRTRCVHSLRDDATLYTPGIHRPLNSPTAADGVYAAVRAAKS